jgi:hypothetical protein
MSRCSVCESYQIVVVLNHSPRAWCSRCGSRWIQEGSEQRRIVRGLFAHGGKRPTAGLASVPADTEPALEGLGA